jgi:hypothetical protein
MFQDIKQGAVRFFESSAGAQSGQFELTPSAPAPSITEMALLVLVPRTSLSLFVAAFVAAATFANILGSPMTRQILGFDKVTHLPSMDITSNAFFAASVTSTALKRMGRYVLAGSVLICVKCAPHHRSTRMGLGGARASTIPFALGFTTRLKMTARMMAIPVMTTNQSSQARPPLPLKSSWTRAIGPRVRLPDSKTGSRQLDGIIVGCIGFWLIEGFSLVDSWYFTVFFDHRRLWYIRICCLMLHDCWK